MITQNEELIRSVPAVLMDILVCQIGASRVYASLIGRDDATTTAAATTVCIDKLGLLYIFPRFDSIRFDLTRGHDGLSDA